MWPSLSHYCNDFVVQPRESGAGTVRVATKIQIRQQEVPCPVGRFVPLALPTVSMSVVMEFVKLKKG
jgi:hypothetical protein